MLQLTFGIPDARGNLEPARRERSTGAHSNDHRYRIGNCRVRTPSVRNRREVNGQAGRTPAEGREATVAIDLGEVRIVTDRSTPDPELDSSYFTP